MVLRTTIVLLLIITASLTLTGCNVNRVQGSVPSQPLLPISTPVAEGTPAPAATPAPPPRPMSSGEITVLSPSSAAELESPITVHCGLPALHEANVQIRIKDERGVVIVNTFTTASAGAPERGQFSAAVSFELDEQQKGTVEVFSTSVRDGEVENLVTIPVILLPN